MRANIEDITKELEQGVQEVFEDENYIKYLDVMSRFYHYSAYNCLLIMMQKPDATLVAGYKAWQSKFNRQVRKGENAIRILAPMPHKITKQVTLEDGTTEDKDIQWTTFRAIPVFDISQTDGEELPTFGIDELNGDVDGYAELIEKVKTSAPVQITFGETGDALGYFSIAGNEIVIKQGMSELQTLKTMIHETAHSILHCKGGAQEKADRNTMEVQAESVAYTVCRALGLDVSDYSFGYVAGWSTGKDTKELTESLNTIRTTANDILKNF